MLLACQWESFTQAGQLQEQAATTYHQLRTTVEDQLCRDPPPQSRIYFSRALVLLSSPLECVACGGSWVVVLGGYLKLSIGYLPEGTGQGQLPCVFCWGSPSMSYKAFFRWLLLVLGLEIPRQGQSVNQGQLLLVWAWGHLVRGAGHAEVRCC